ncbi:MAG: hypothetical protein J6Q69_07120 [Clostridia bacterium]|nr:hypothetical protein [Clostridia bacterium]
MKLLRSLADKILPALFFISVMLAFDAPALAIMTVLCAALHEIGHLGAALMVSQRNLPLPRATVFGFKIDTGALLSYNEELFIALGGPLVNAALFLLLLPFFFIEYIKILAVFNLFCALSNLIPIRGYDGFRILNTLLVRRDGGSDAARLLGQLSALLSGVGALVFLAFLMIFGEGYWIFTLFFAALMREIAKNTKNEIS